MSRPRLRKTLWSDRPLDQQAKDLRAIFRGIPQTEIREHEGFYQTGLTLRLEAGAQPIAIELVRCVDADAPDSPVANGSAVSFRRVQQGAEITRIDGLTPDTTAKYKLTFRITYQDDN